jgi:DNA-binding response OmpR family regulator
LWKFLRKTKNKMAYKLIVGDASPSVQKIIQMAFPETNFELHFFEDGLEVIQSLGSINPDAVLISLSLPSRDGYEVGRYLRGRENFKKTALILLRNAFETLDLEKLRGLECDEIVLKPFDSEKLARTVREIIDRKKGPHSFPEESFLEESAAPAALPLFEEEEFAPSPLTTSEGDLEEKVKHLLKEEVLSMERELEKRLRVTLRAEFQRVLDAASKKTP